MNRLNLLFFSILISFIHNYYSEFNNIFLQSFFFLFLSELINVKLFNRYKSNQQNQTNQDDDSSAVSDISEDEENVNEEDKIEEDEDKIEEDEDKIKEEEDKIEEEYKIKEEYKEKKAKVDEDSEETEEESDETEGSSDEPVDITEGGDINQMEILRLLNNFDSLGDSGLMELKKKMLELDKLVEFYKNDTKKTRKD
jgi:hypothetical protein